MSTVQTTWFCLLIILQCGYTVLAGFDLGIGVLHLFACREERRVLLSAVAPFWDGNQVWLVTLGGALFAAFPAIYATLFSAGYLALVLLLAALILRSVAIEYAGKARGLGGERAWGLAFALGSVSAIVLFGVVLGNIARGFPLDAAGQYTGAFFGLLNPFALTVGLLNLVMIATHGALYLALKTEGSLQSRARDWARRAGLCYLPLALLTIAWAACAQPAMLAKYLDLPALFVVPLGALAAISVALRWNRAGKSRPAFLASAAGMCLLLLSLALGLYPTLLPALHHPAWDLTVFNSSSSYLTLKTMLIITLLGMPLVLGYTIWGYRIFRGPIQSEEEY